MRPEEQADNKPVIIGVINPAEVMAKGNTTELSASLVKNELVTTMGSMKPVMLVILTPASPTAAVLLKEGWSFFIKMFDILIC